MHLQEGRPYMPTFSHIGRGKFILSFCNSCGIFLAAARHEPLLTVVESLHRCAAVREHKDLGRLLAESRELLKKKEP
jgi:hypothetical protein